MTSRSEKTADILDSPKNIAERIQNESIGNQRFARYGKGIIIASFIAIALVLSTGSSKHETLSTTSFEKSVNFGTAKEKPEKKDSDTAKNDTPQNNANSNSILDGLSFYFKTVSTSFIDYIIYGWGISLSVWCVWCIKDEKNLRTPQLAKRRDWIAVGCETLPLMGLGGTVLSLMNTLGSIGNTVDPNSIVVKFAPALSTTLSGMIWLVLNLFLLQCLGSIIHKREQVNQN
ncbi:MAG: MotA/TolQ/ExbB proton channel family protein [Planctomycetaceae bacterium]|jgi:hypothetical protein|nr:MotA/TolQ/ExbB proton channel family protein [Planctomycetaceae bacterium]